MHYNLDFCDICDYPTSARCSRCQVINYCSRECQSKDWIKHKYICATMKKRRSFRLRNNNNNDSKQGNRQPVLILGGEVGDWSWYKEVYPYKSKYWFGLYHKLSYDEILRLKEKRSYKKPSHEVEVLFTKKKPKILPLPQDEGDLNERWINFYSRKLGETKRTIIGFFVARNMYYNAVRQIFFIAVNSFGKIKEMFPLYKMKTHTDGLEKIIEVLQKIAECDYFLGLFDEAMTICDTNKAVVRILWSLGEAKRKMMGFTLGVMARCMMEKRKLVMATECIEKGLNLDPSSSDLMKIEGELVKMIQDTDFESERFEITKDEEDYTFETYQIRFPLGEMYVDVESMDSKKDLQERIEYLFDEQAMRKQNIDELMLTCKVGETLNVLIWKSMMF